MNIKTIQVPGAEAVAKLHELRGRFPETGEYPFMIGEADELERLEEASDFLEQTPEEIIAASLVVDVDRWIEERRREAGEDDLDPDELLGEWPGEVDEKGSMSLHVDHKGKFKRQMYIGLATIERPWQLPAALRYGAWNACPHPEVHCALHRRWAEEFGALITGVSGDVVECLVTNPPLDQATAIALAWQQYWYCPDIVEQGCETISELAATLLNSPYWFFWWD